MNRSLAFFDVDTREPDPGRGGLRFRERVEPIQAKLETLLNLADEQGIPVVTSACVNAGLTAAHIPEEAIFVPEHPWDGSLSGARQVFLAKKTLGSPEINIRSRAYDAFCANPNAAWVITELGIDQWVVFGTSVEFCIQATVEGLLDAGRRVTVLEDVLALGPGGEEAAAKALEHFRARGARLITMQAFLKEWAG